MRPLDRFAIPLAFATLALSWPLLDLVGNNAEFFLSRQSPRLDVALFALTVGIGIPVVIGLVGLVPHRRGGLYLWLTMVALLAAAMVRLALRPAPLFDWARTAIAIALGIVVAGAAYRFAGVKLMARYMLVGPVVVTALFFLATPTGAVVRSIGEEIGSSVTPVDPVPIIWIGFDEFPVASLMLADGSLNEAQYPNFARLASDGTWFRNAVGIEQQTEQAFPAILTGVRPVGDQPPFAGEYPNTAFSLLGQAYDVTAIEAITRLCPESVCGTPTPVLAGGARSRALIDDTLVVAGHLLLPEAISNGLPSIDGGWGDFGGAVEEDFSAVAEFREQMESERRTPVAQFVKAIGPPPPDGKPFFGFLHILIPHHPWQYLPTGQSYPLIAEKSPGTTRTGWGSDQWLLDQGTQRHLLQVGYADHALGQILDALDAAGVYEEAIVVVMADHGIAIKPDVFHQRYITAETVGQIASVPLFIKGPGMAADIIDDRRAETVDVLPTVAALLGVEIPWPTDGISLLGQVDRSESTMSAPQGPVTFGVDGLEKLEVAADIARAFPTGDPFELRPPGAPDLRHQMIPVSQLLLAPIRWTLDRPQWFNDVSPESDVVPARVTGLLWGATGDEVLAVVLNGRIEATTRAYVDDKQVVRFQAMVPPDSFRMGDNRIDLVLLDGTDLLFVAPN